jgi:PAS domain S-box-containing protein
MSTKSKKVAACGLCVKKETRASNEVTHMEKKEGTERRLAELREQAESKVKQHIVKLREQPSMNSDQLIQELGIHQIELEMQNEELRQSQLELDESRTKYLDLFEFAPVGYFTLNENGLILEANLTSTNLLDVERRNLINRRLSHFITADTGDVFHLHYREVLRTKSKQTCELKLKRADGSEFHAEMVKIPCRDPGGSLT